MNTQARFFSFFPAASLLLAALLGLTPLPFAQGLIPMPCLAMIAVFYWCLLTPVLISPLILIVTGVVLDSFSSPALGMYVFVFLFLRLVLRKMNHHFARKTTWFFWGGFWLLSLPCWVLFWILTILTTDTMLSPVPALLQWGITGLCYPLLHLLFTRSLPMLSLVR